MQIDNFVESNPSEFHYDITPLTAGCTTTTTQSGRMKLVGKIGIGESDLCLIIAICRQSRDGLLVMCRQQSPQSPQSLFESILRFLENLLNIVLFPLLLPHLTPVNQNDCIVENDSCFV